MNVTKKQIADLVTARINALVTKTLETHFGVEIAFGSVQIDSRRPSQLVNFMKSIDVKTGLFQQLNKIVKQYLDTSKTLSTDVENEDVKLHDRFFEKDSKWKRLYYTDEELVQNSLRKLAQERAQRDFEAAVEFVEKSAQNSETSGKSQI